MIKIIRAKPNPAGKDRTRILVFPQKLAGEWIDIKNEGHFDVRLNGLQVYHLAYKAIKEEMEMVKEFRFGSLFQPTQGILRPGKVLRIHSGGRIPITKLLLIDRIGADFHTFTGKNYIWNNDKKDVPAIWNPRTEKWEDETWYDANPPEGAILKRVNDKLIPRA